MHIIYITELADMKYMLNLLHKNRYVIYFTRYNQNTIYFNRLFINFLADVLFNEGKVYFKEKESASKDAILPERKIEGKNEIAYRYF